MLLWLFHIGNLQYTIPPKNLFFKKKTSTDLESELRVAINIIFKMASDKEYNADLAAVCSEEKKFILRALQYCQDDASSRKGWWYDIFARFFFFVRSFFFYRVVH